MQAAQVPSTGENAMRERIGDAVKSAIGWMNAQRREKGREAQLEKLQPQQFRPQCLQQVTLKTLSPE